MGVGLAAATSFAAAAAVLAAAAAPPTIAAPDTTAPSAPGRGPPDEGDASTEPGYAWPLLPPPAVLAPFGAPEDPFGPGHRGVDLAGAIGQPVLAARGGTVAFAGPVAGHGVVSVQHDDGLRTTYEPLLPSVRAGDVVAAGAVLGTLVAGHRGCASPCLHWGMRRDRLEYLDPLVLLRPSRVRLLPVPEPWPDP
jgi:murein DD-endopeptidase MepM/ murein hydrolase activator NlpD